MTDFKFKIHGVNNGYLDQLVWRAMYAGLVPKELHEKPVEAVRHVQKEWRARVVVLRDAGLTRAREAGFQYLRNCPPVSVITGTRAVPCNCRRICPFCWSRQVIRPVWERVLGVLFDGTAKRSRPEFDLIRFGRVDRYDDLDEAVQVCDKTRPGLALKSDYGSVVLRTVVPSIKQAGQTVVHQAGLHIIERGEEVPERAGKGFTLNLFERVNRDTLARRVLPRICRYPAEMMLGDANLVVEVVNNTQHLRCCRFAGSLYRISTTEGT